MAAANLTAARLREFVSYDPLTGEFTRLVGGCGKGNTLGAIAGHPDGQGYIRL